MEAMSFRHSNVIIEQSYGPFGKHVEAKIDHGDYFELISIHDKRAHDAFIALHNYKVEMGLK